MAEFEFDAEHEETIARLAAAMQNVGVVGLFGGMAGFLRELAAWALLGVLFTKLGILAVVVTVLPIVISGLLIRAGRKLMAVVRTQGEDITNLMAGVEGLATIYLLETITTAASLVIVAWLLFGVLS